MLTIGIQYLTGRAVATHTADRDTPEWPPHPARVFLALAATWFETEGTGPERAALEWLEAQGTPELRASEAGFRTPVTAFVPVNDESSPIDDKKRVRMPLQSMPLGRARQPRTWPTAVPEHDVVHLVWPDLDAAAHRAPLDDLCRRVTRLGHSSSLVQMWVDDVADDTAPRWVADDLTPAFHLRVVESTEGTLDRLAADYAAVLRPRISTARGYALARPEPRARARTGPFDPRLLIFRLEREAGPSRLELATTQRFMEALRGAILACHAEPIPEVISGHEADGAPSRCPHMALFPLPFVGHTHATGHLLGAAVALPKDLDETSRTRLLMEIARITENPLTLGALGRFGLRPEMRELPPESLRPHTWTAGVRGATRWATVTPLVLDRHPKGRDREASSKKLIIASCERAGLPRPVHVGLGPVSPFAGVPTTREMPPFRRQDQGRRPAVHAALVFDEPVQGPLLLGAGRYRGHGVLRPWKEGIPQ